MKLGFIIAASVLLGYITNSAIAYAERIRREMRWRTTEDRRERHYDSDDIGRS